MPPDTRWRNTGVREHARENIAIEHALHGHAFGGGLEPGDAPDGVDQGLAMMRTRAAQQSSVDIEEHQGSGARLIARDHRILHDIRLLE